MQVRPLLQDIIRTSLQKSKTSLTGRDNAEIAEHISRTAEQEKQREKSATSRNLECWLVAAAASSVESWLKQNNHGDIWQHTAFIAVWRHVHQKLVACSNLSETDVKAYTCSASLADFVYWMSEAIFEHIPYAVPTVPMALLSRVIHDQQAVPPFLHFLCVQPVLCMHFLGTN